MTRGDDLQRRSYRVVGRVQGVGFRWWTRGVALDLRIGGYVRNLPGGAVEVHAVGTASALDRLEDELREGPPAARVDEVEGIPTDPKASADGFQIART